MTASDCALCQPEMGDQRKVPAGVPAAPLSLSWDPSLILWAFLAAVVHWLLGDGVLLPTKV